MREKGQGLGVERERASSLRGAAAGAGGTRPGSSVNGGGERLGLISRHRPQEVGRKWGRAAR